VSWVSVKAAATTAPVSAGQSPRRRVSGPRAWAEVVVIGITVALYVAFALEVLLLSRAPGSERSVNLVPFASITTFAFADAPGTGRFAFANLVGNVLIFVPLGAYASWLRRRPTVAVTLVTVVCVSVAVEVVQGVLAMGTSDVDDVILNCVGGLIGILAFRLLTAVLGTPARVRTAMAVLSVLSVPVWCYFLLFIHLRM
jgi:glycopeptide antibiotics resistance protein